jgi:uncharacterized protein involved in exopolysaccharide biosynthesis
VADLTGHYTEELQRFDIRRFWHSFVERIWIVAICVLAGFFLALGYLARTPKLYQGHSVLEVNFRSRVFFRPTIPRRACGPCFWPARRRCGPLNRI